MNPRINMESFAQGIKGTGSRALEKEAVETSYGKKSGLNEIGRISVGESMEGRQFPSSIDYFRFVTIHKMVEKRVYDLYGNKPNSLPVFFNSDRMEDHCIEKMELRDNAGKMIAFSDGETFNVWNAAKKIYAKTTLEKTPDIAAKCLALARNGLAENKAAAIDWAHTLTLRFCIMNTPSMGFWQFTTKGAKSTIVALRNSIDQCHETLGRFSFLPFDLTVKIAESNTPGSKRKYPVVSLTPAISFEIAMKLAEYNNQNEGFKRANLAMIDLRNPEVIRQIAAAEMPNNNVLLLK